MQLWFAGYLPIRFAPPAGWQGPAHVREICSVSECLCGAPEGRIDRWLHNELGFYDTTEVARSVIENDAKDFDLFAYDVLGLRFSVAAPEAFLPPRVEAVERRSEMKLLGFDVVSKDVCLFFEHSPLSCNGCFEWCQVNEYCLVTDLPTALALAERCGREEPEPGPYYVLRVSRLATEQ